jgi:rhodanese-related sulfurtransferase
VTVLAEADFDLRRLKLPLPFVYEGEVVVDVDVEDDVQKPRVPGALVRAYTYVTAAGRYTSDISESAAVIPVAEARADENGKFELMIPASLHER